MCKCILILVIITSFQAFSHGYGQDKINVNLEDISLKKAFKEIEKNTTYRFLYNDDLLKDYARKSLQVSNASLNEVMNALLTNTNLAYHSTENNLIIISFRQSQKLAFPVTGIVTDNAGEPLIGVSVKVKNTETGTSTDADGKFSIVVPNESAVLVFSYIGFQNQERQVGNSKMLNIKMEPQNTNLNEVVVVGYGTQRRADITSAVTSVKSENFVKGAVKDAGQLLQGKVAGLTVASPTGDPTASSQIMLRGTATLATSTQPLILIDGVPGDMNTVAPEDIESMDVLKDGSAAAIYGTRGTNGVILITTKRPNGNIEPTIDYNGYTSTQRFVNLPKMLSATEYRSKLAEGAAFQDLGSETDWMDEVSRKTPLSQVHNLTYKGGSSKTNYLASLSYRYFEGVFLKSDNRTLNGRIDVNHNMFNNKLKVNFNLLNTDNKYNSLGDGASFDNTIFRQALIRNPTAPTRNSDGTWQEQTGIASYENPLALLYESYGKNESQSTRISGSITWVPITGLQLKALGSRNKYNSVYGYAETKNNISTVRDAIQGLALKSDGQNIDQLFELTGEYSKSVEDHRFTALAGYSYQHNTASSTNLRNYDFPAGNFSYIDNIGAGNAYKVGNQNLMSSNKNAWNLIGFFGRLTYNYKEKYLLMANLRHEGSSKFVGTNQPWGTFPSISAGWRLSRENFMSGISFLDELKLRGGYGVTGTAPDKLFIAVSRLGYSGSFLVDGEWVPSLSPVSNPNPDLKWEVKKETNLGLDFAILKGKVSGNIDYYIRRTEGLLYDYPVPSPPNLFEFTTANVGEMENKGIEVFLNVNPVSTKKFSWNSSLNFSTNRNKLKSLSNDLYQVTNNFINVGFTGSPVQTYTHRIEVGKEIGNFYGYKVVNVTDDGNWLYESNDGTPVTISERSEDDKQVLGNGLPKYYAGWNNNFRYGRLDLSLTMRGAFDYQILNFQRMYSEIPGFTLYNQMRSAYDQVFGKAILNKNVQPDFNSYYVENGDFWKIDNMTLGYNFNLPMKHVRNARVYVSTLNTLTLSGYKGMDPEVNRLGLTPGNDDRDKYPSTRVYTLGLNVSIN